jgi:hypothetical protein
LDFVDLTLKYFFSVCQWASGCILRSCYGVKPAFYKLFPLACLLENYEGDDEISKNCTHFLAYLAFSLTPPEVIPVALQAVKEVRIVKIMEWEIA